MKKLTASLFLLLFLVGGSFSQKLISNQTNAWVLYTGNHKISENFGIHTEYQWRRANGFNHWQQSLARIGLDYYVNPNLSATAGYGWIITYPYGDQPVLHQFIESRIWEQVNAKAKYGRVELQHRYRLEQRFMENYVKNTDGSITKGDNIFRQRVRYRGMVLVPISRKEMSDNTFFLNVNDEVFVNFGKGIGKNIFDQNRLNFALGWRFNKDFNVQVGYLNQFIEKADGIRNERNHTLLISTVYNFDFTKKKAK